MLTLRKIAISLLALTSFGAVATSWGCDSIRVLILSGQNNHDWQTTTPMISKILEFDKRIEVEVTEKSETLTSEDLKEVDVILSDWNQYGKTKVDWPIETRNAVADFVKSGKGFVVVHAGSTSFDDWADYKTITGGWWNVGQTHHDKPHTFKVEYSEEPHSITEGLDDFTTTDELWLLPELSPDAKVIASSEGQPSALVTSFGEGRGFTILLGHSAEFMENCGFQKLLLRGTLWAAGE